jgi:hypothetical protein
MATEECPICVSQFTTTVKKPISCPKCNHVACIQCVRQYMLGLINDPHCMNCNFGWTPTFIRQNLTITFVNNDWANHRRQILWRREEAYLPESQVVAERIVQGRNMEKDLEPLRKKRTEIVKMLDQIDIELNIKMRTMNRLQQGLDPSGSAAIKSATERKAFVRRCTFTGCNGFLSTAWKCGICENYSCSECLAVKGKDRDAEHTCKPDDIATAKLLAKDTKPCPKCGEGIFRTEGCSQMFCTACKTPFDWNTGKIISGGLIHNPHYFAYMREHGNAPGRAVGDIQCGGMPHFRDLSGVKNKENRTQMEEIFRNINHTIDVEARRFTAHIDELHNQDYRVKYLLNEIKKEDIEQVLINQERKRERHRVIREVMDTFGNVGAEIFRRFIADATAKATATAWDDLWPTYRAELEGLRDYCNNELLTISYYYKCSVPQWGTENWSITNQSEADMRRTERNRVLAAYQKLKDTKAAHAPVPTVAPAVPVAMPTITIPNIPGLPDLVIKLPAVEPGTAAAPK